MSRSETLATRLGEVILNGTWIANTNWKDQLEQSDWQEATAQSPSTNTIAALAQHIHYYVAGVKEVFLTGKLEIRDKYSFEFPAITSQSQWQEFQDLFWADTVALINHVRALSEEQLTQPFVKREYGDYYRNIDAMIEHSYYHLGQVVLLRKQAADLTGHIR